MRGALGKTEEIARAAVDCVHLVADVHIEGAGAADHEPKLVVVAVGVLVDELRPGGLDRLRPAGVLARMHADDVNGGEAQVGDELVDHVPVDGKDGVLVGVGGQIGGDRAALVAAADLPERRGDLARVGGLAQHRRRVAGRPGEE